VLSADCLPELLGAKAMRQVNQTIRLLGRHYRELAAVDATLPVDIQVLLLRLALKEIERTHYCAREQPRHAASNY
jgi:hypothetical protein